ncbi:ketohexokinase-like protein [Pleomassaria siparia CBS 279.74]|uniref:Ketohexokinase-like protein n=1 Tax=Pleomassaria siparia CBS 279.74 TaxID=1314801 RepID=A0A6G1JTT0_9PLEO|nr:ketohexokinase-like protein [Pleomassaria siparia CBS 279.74]
MVAHIVCVGAIYIDTVLTIPHFPIEDQKLRASKRTRRRGGNCGNTLEVLHQLVGTFGARQASLHLLSVLPNEHSADTEFIRNSFVGEDDQQPSVDINVTCVFRHDSQEAASSFIFWNEEKRTRTIVSINQLAELTVPEFILSATRVEDSKVDAGSRQWWHFEGRIPENTVQMIKHMRSTPHWQNAQISIELEKPEREEGLREIVPFADVIFCSKLWATTFGYTSAQAFLEHQLPQTRDNVTLCCTWGSGGATAVKKASNGIEWQSVEAWKSVHGERPVVDTIGAGDTFVAGMLFGFNFHSDDWSLEQKLSFANELAGRKVTQEGFGGLGRQMAASLDACQGCSTSP